MKMRQTVATMTFVSCLFHTAAPFLRTAVYPKVSSFLTPKHDLVHHLQLTPAKKHHMSNRLGGRKQRRPRKKKNFGGSVVVACFALPLLLGVASWFSVMDDTEVYYYESTRITQTVVSPDGRMETTQKESQRSNMMGSRNLFDEETKNTDEMILTDGAFRQLLKDAMDSAYLE